MPLSFPPGALTLGVLAFTGAAVLLALPPGTCAVSVQQTGVNPLLRQVRVTVQVKPGCPVSHRAVIRFRTVGGGLIPLNGYILRPTYPNRYSFWLSRQQTGRPGPTVEQQIGGRWKTIWRLGL